MDREEYAVQVRHRGFIDRFLIMADPPADIGMSIWSTTDALEILRFARRKSAVNVRDSYQLHFAARGEHEYSFVLMKMASTPMWVDAR